MKRGWILVMSVLIEAIVFAGIYSFFSSTVSPILGEIVGVIGVLLLGFILIYSWWAPNNLYFTFVPEGRAKIVVRGDAFKKALLQWEGYELAEQSSDKANKWDIVERPGRRQGRWGGLRYYGFWPLDDIFVYDFSWTGVSQDGQIQTHEKELLDYILVKTDVYWAQVKKAEDKNMLPLDVELVLTIRILNPYKALFRVQNWLETTINRIEPAVRNAITEDSYERWISQEKDLADRIITDPQTQELLNELKLSFGVGVFAIEVRSINPSTAELDEARRATLKKYLAEKERDRIVVEAEAEKARLETVYKTIQEMGDVGKLIRTLEALEKAPREGSKLIILPGLTDVVSRVFLGRELSSLTSEDIKQIREILEKFLRENQDKKTS